MADENEAQLRRQDDHKTHTKALLRFFSVESDMNMSTQINSPPEFPHNFYSRDFFLKIAQLLIGMTCAGLYSEGVKVMTDSITSQTFPNVVFSSFIIITSVIVMGYVLGHMMPDILVRIFNAIGLVLYFISATVTIYTWFNKHVVEPELRIPMRLLIAQAINSYINSFLYGLDMFLSIKKAIIFEV